MNKIAIVFSSFLFLLILIFQAEKTQAQGRNVEEVTLTVLGNCGMCKDRIEKAAYTVRGVRRADWDMNKQKLTLSFRNDRTDQETIERAIAKAGHDTENFLTDEKTHANLHHCCVYKRDPELLKNNKVWNDK
jgi:periplasmic mercuric ion binding protein